MKVERLIACLAKDQEKTEAIKNLQHFVWEDDEFFTLNEQLQQILSELAHDLDFYVADENMRKQVPSYYGEEKLNEEIASVIKKMGELKTR